MESSRPPPAVGLRLLRLAFYTEQPIQLRDLEYLNNVGGGIDKANFYSQGFRMLAREHERTDHSGTHERDARQAHVDPLIFGLCSTLDRIDQLCFMHDAQPALEDRSGKHDELGEFLTKTNEIEFFTGMILWDRLRGTAAEKMKATKKRTLWRY